MASKLDENFIRPRLEEDEIGHKRQDKTMLTPLPPKFTINYCRNCDGGQEEMNSVALCVREIFPQSAIRIIRTDNVKARLTITTDAFGQSQVIWTGKQSNLLSRLPKRRHKTLQLIKSTLADLQETIWKDR